MYSFVGFANLTPVIYPVYILNKYIMPGLCIILRCRCMKPKKNFGLQFYLSWIYTQHGIYACSFTLYLHPASLNVHVIVAEGHKLWRCLSTSSLGIFEGSHLLGHDMGNLGQLCWWVWNKKNKFFTLWVRLIK